MSISSLLSSFKSADLSSFPDIHSVINDEDKIIWILSVIEEFGTDEYVTSTDISYILTDYFGVAISWQRVSAILKIECGIKTVAKKRVKGRQHFRVMKSGADRINGNSVDVLYIDPTNALTSIRNAEELFSSLDGNLFICDPYIDNKTLDYLSEFTKAKTINLLTTVVHSESKFKRDLKGFHLQYPKFLKLKKLAPGFLHDRYIIYDKGMLLMGGSLNGLGSKQSFIVSIGNDIKANVLKAFKGHWNTAADYP